MIDAISSGLPTLPAGCCLWSASVGFGPCLTLFFFQFDTSIHPGLTQFTRTLGPRLKARAWERAKMPPLEAEYASVSASDMKARVEATFTIVPRHSLR